MGDHLNVGAVPYLRVEWAISGKMIWEQVSGKRCVLPLRKPAVKAGFPFHVGCGNAVRSLSGTPFRLMSTLYAVISFVFGG